MARPPKAINWEIVIKRMQAGNTAKQIAKEHEINIDTFYDRFKKEFEVGFSDYSDDMYECGDANIAFTQYMKSLSGNVQMLIHLGRVRLGQKEPDNVSTLATLQPQIDQSQRIMELEHENAILKEQNANKPKTE